MMESRIDQKLSDELYILKAVAICSAVMAHSCYSEVENVIDVYILGRFSRFGVVAFFFLSGFFFKHEAFCTFLKKTIKKLIIPWLFLGTGVWFGSMLLIDHRIDVEGYWEYIIGNGSTLYFCTVLLLLKCIFQIITCPKVMDRIHNKGLIRICAFFILCTLVSLFITARGILPQSYDPTKELYEYVNPYLNIFNWIGVFAGGILTRQLQGFAFLKSNRRIKVLACVLSLCVFCIGLFDTSCSYFSYFGIYVEVSLLIMIFLMVDTMYPVLKKKFAIFAGKNTYPLFLLHYPVLALLMHNTNNSTLLQIGDSNILSELRSSFVFALLRPVLCVAILCLVFVIAKLFAKRLHLLNALNTMTGIK